MKEIPKQTHVPYGARRISEELKAQGEQCGKSKAETLMRLARVRAKQKKKFKATTDSKHGLAVAPNLLKREFAFNEPDRVYCSNITYIWTKEGWLYLAVIIDLFSRSLVGWSLGNRITKQLVINALRMSVWRRRPNSVVIFHTDRRSQYCSKAFQKELKKYGMLSSMSIKGDCWDNSVAESFFATLKIERVFESVYNTRKEARVDIVDCIEMFSNNCAGSTEIGVFLCLS